MEKILTHRLLGIALLVVVVFGIGVLFPARIQLHKPLVSANVAEATVFVDRLGVTLCGITIADAHRCVLEDVAPECVNALRSTTPDQSKCTNDDKTVLRQVASCSPTRGFWDTFTEVGTGVNCTDTQRQQSSRAADMYANTVMSCSGLSNYWSNPLRCTTRLVTVGLSTVLISISAWVLALSALIFNWSVDNTILLFSSSVFDKVEGGVNAGWTAMRDIANIVIIGMFTFIAISTILGIQEYGARKLLARVLVIAVLINFSLLFTKIIIDTSNFTAAQFYASSSGYTSIGDAQTAAATRSSGGVHLTEDPVTGASGSSLNQLQQIGIAGAFIRFLGVTSVSDTAKALDAGGETQGGWVVLAHGILATILLLATAFILLYGTYLLISRAVLFIFLMVTAAGAFATHLIPKMNESEYGWDGWWSSLLHNAALAPILMILLWVTLKVSSKMSDLSNGTLGGLASGSPGTSIGPLFSYLIILGLLWGSFLLASKWASKVGGLKFTGTILSSMAVAPAALASRFIAAPIARKVLGGGAAAKSMMLEDKIKARSLAASQLDPKSQQYKDAVGEITGMMKQKDRADWRAKGSYNAANLKLAQQGMKGLGVPSFLSGAAKSGGYAETAKERADKAIKDAEKLVLKKEDFSSPEAQHKIAEELKLKRKDTENFRRLRSAVENLERTASTATQDRDRQTPWLTARLTSAQADKAAHEQNLSTATSDRDIQLAHVTDIKSQKATADAEVQSSETKMNNLAITSHAKMTDLDRIIRDKGATSPEGTAALTEQATERAQTQSAIATETARIKAAQAESNRLAQEIPAQEQILANLNATVQTATTNLTAATSTVAQIEGQIVTLNNNVIKAVDGLGEGVSEIQNEENRDATDAEINVEIGNIINRSKDLAVGAATRAVHRRLANIPNVWLGQSEDNDTMSQFTRKQAGSSAGIKYKDFREAMSVVQSQLGTATQAPPLPSAGPTGGGHQGP